MWDGGGGQMHVCYVMKGSKVKDVKHFVLECELGV